LWRNFSGLVRSGVALYKSSKDGTLLMLSERFASGGTGLSLVLIGRVKVSSLPEADHLEVL